MKRLIAIIFLTLISALIILPKVSYAIEDPLSCTNNKMGVHILFTSEIDSAASLVNSNGGDWGYVTIPIQAGDRDMVKWQKFMDEAKRLHVIPLIRLATEGDYFNTSVWRKPNEADILDFANFLNSLQWPVKNRYIIVFNEVNRSDEWGGELNAEEYANLLKYTADTFRGLNNDFFIISSGLDNAAPNLPGKYMNQYDYMIAMDEAVPGIFRMIDGLGSHSYPNPGFKQMPYILTSQSISSFNFEKDLAFRLSNKNLPVFITETGWSKDVLSENQIASNFKYAFDYVWSDKSIIAVTSFLLRAGSNPFSQFSLINENGQCNGIYTALAEIPKVKGAPTINDFVSVSVDPTPKNLPEKVFPKKVQYDNSLPQYKTNTILDFFRWLFRISS